MLALHHLNDSRSQRVLWLLEELGLPYEMKRSAAASAEAPAKVTEYVTALFEAGEKDAHRLTVCGLTYLRELDGSNDPVKAGFTGL